MPNDGFVNDLMKHILEGVKIPKVQVERAISPILGLYIESILTAYFNNNTEFSGSYKLISPEFPLKKENKQSTNIDYLLINNSKKLLVFFELKTDIGSLDIKQMNRYLDYKNRIRDSSASILRQNLDEISSASSKSVKYDYIISRFDSAVESVKDIKNTVILYLVPKAIKNQIEKMGRVDFVLDYNDLPKSIEHKYSNYWRDVRSNLLILDDIFKHKTISNLSADPLRVIIGNIKKYLLGSNSMLQPVYIQLGILGDGKKPNYQVKFDDGSIKTFRFSGKPHNIKVFRDKNLGLKHCWVDIRNKA